MGGTDFAQFTVTTQGHTLILKGIDPPLADVGTQHYNGTAKDNGSTATIFTGNWSATTTTGVLEKATFTLTVTP